MKNSTTSLVIAAVAAALTMSSATASGSTSANSGTYGVTLLHSFSPGEKSGQEPGIGSLTLGSDGNFYGATVYGGPTETGTLFRMKPDGTTTTLHTFAALTPGSLLNADGRFPSGSLVQGSDGNFYGAAQAGGVNGSGTLFRMTPKGKVTVLYAFSAADAQTDINADGDQPNAPLLLARDGSIYGTTFKGGEYGNGVAFQLAPDGALTVLHNFGQPTTPSHTDAALPSSGFILGADGLYYGTTDTGGPSYAGSIYQLGASGQFKVLHYFDLTDGDGPFGPLLQDTDGTLYGTTLDDKIYSITPSGQFRDLHSGNDQGRYVGNDLNIDGATLYAGLTRGSDGNFYGTASLGGEFGNGDIFRITPAGDFSVLYYFGNAPDGDAPQGGVIFGNDGNLYGTTLLGGTMNQGSIFELPLPAPDGWGTGPAITISVSLAPKIISLSKGQTATLTWSSVNAAQCHLNGQPLATSGTMSIAPKRKGFFSYDVACDNAGRATTVSAGQLDVKN